LAHAVSEERVGAPATVMLPGSWSGAIAGAGRGFAAYPQLRSRIGDRLATIRDELLPRAHEIAVLAAPVVRSGGALPAEQALPVYVRNEVAQAPKASGK